MGRRWVMAIGCLLVAVLTVAWVSKPGSIHARLEERGVHLVKIHPEPEILRLAMAKPAAVYYSIQTGTEADLVRCLAESGYSEKYGTMTIRSHSSSGAIISLQERILTRGRRIRWLIDFDRVWLIEFEGKKMVAFDPDGR